MIHVRPTLLILAAGMGSRYGGLKQLDGLGPAGETIMDYSVYDAICAGFGRIVFVIRQSFEEDFRSKILSKYKDRIPIDVVFQDMNKLPEGFDCPEGREKPWGTNHAVMMGRDVIKEPFAVINADDFYGRSGYQALVERLRDLAKGTGHYCMVGFRVGNTLSESGAVSRGVCTTSPDGKLKTVVERTNIRRAKDGRIVCPDESGAELILEAHTPVSMNMWGFTPDYFDHSEDAFRQFLSLHIQEPKSEFYIPTVIDGLISSGYAEVEVLDTDAQWFGVTYPEDRPAVVKRLAELTAQGEYPSPLFG